MAKRRGQQSRMSDGQGRHDAPKIPDKRRVVKGNLPENVGLAWRAGGNLLRLLRRNAGFKTQGELAQAVGVERTTVSDWERGAQKPSGVHLGRLADIGGVDVVQLEAGVPGAIRISLSMRGPSPSG